MNENYSVDIYNQIVKLNKELYKQIEKYRKAGIDYAVSYRKYRILLSQELFKLKSEGMPVTIAYDIARGEKNVANAKYDELSKYAIYEADKQQINAIKINIKVLKNQYDKEWSVAGENNF